jgi:hypothetical protein
MSSPNYAVLSLLVPPAVSLLTGLMKIGGRVAYLFAALLGLAGAVAVLHFNPRAPVAPLGGIYVALPLLCILMTLIGRSARRASPDDRCD